MKRRRIGFCPDDIDTDDEKGGEDWLTKMFTANKEHVKQFIEANYTPIGSTEQKDFKTSAELIYMLSETIDVSIKVVNEVMNELQYQMQYIDQVPNWVLYSKEISNDE